MKAAEPTLSDRFLFIDAGFLKAGLTPPGSALFGGVLLFTNVPVCVERHERGGVDGVHPSLAERRTLEDQVHDRELPQRGKKG